MTTSTKSTFTPTSAQNGGHGSPLKKPCFLMRVGVRAKELVFGVLSEMGSGVLPDMTSRLKKGLPRPALKYPCKSFFL